MNLGCRRLNYDGCILTAESNFYTCTSQGGFGNIFGICQTVKDGADADCSNQFPGNTRKARSLSSSASSEARSLDAAAECDGNSTTRSSYELFDFTDKDGDGNLTLTEYFNIMGVSMGATEAEVAARRKWTKFYLS